MQKSKKNKTTKASPLKRDMAKRKAAKGHRKAKEHADQWAVHLVKPFRTKPFVSCKALFADAKDAKNDLTIALDKVESIQPLLAIQCFHEFGIEIVKNSGPEFLKFKTQVALLGEMLGWDGAQLANVRRRMLGHVCQHMYLHNRVAYKSFLKDVTDTQRKAIEGKRKYDSNAKRQADSKKSKAAKEAKRADVLANPQHVIADRCAAMYRASHRDAEAAQAAKRGNSADVYVQDMALCKARVLELVPKYDQAKFQI
jgi:hypothetical protein